MLTETQTTFIHGITGDEIALPKFGDKMAGNSATVICYTHQHDGGNGFLPNGVVLAFYPLRSKPEYVTWQLACNERGEWNAEIGHYFNSIVKAAADYAERGGK